MKEAMVKCYWVWQREGQCLDGWQWHTHTHKGKGKGKGKRGAWGPVGAWVPGCLGAWVPGSLGQWGKA